MNKETIAAQCQANQGPNFGIIYADDAYTTKNKLMGRQVAGKSLLRGMARFWPEGEFSLLCYQAQDAHGLGAELQSNGWVGRIKASLLPNSSALPATRTLYYPAPPCPNLAALRSAIDPQAFSLMGVTHTVSSENALDQIASLILPPFKPWDALICTSTAAQKLVHDLHDEMRAYWAQHLGATKFNTPQTPVIPLGINADEFVVTQKARADARRALNISSEVVFLFAGRLSFHAKANAAPLYAALEEAAKHTKIICLEAGKYPSETTAAHFQRAQQEIAPSVDFRHIDGDDAEAYRRAWQSADVFTSLSDNIQETFGLTPVEAMAAGLPVLVSDWNGYRDTVRDGIDGIRVPTFLPSPGSGAILSVRHALGIDTYDYYIGRTSLATSVNPRLLKDACIKLASDPKLRKKMGEEGKKRARHIFDWSSILPQYEELSLQLAQMRTAADPAPKHAWPTRADPFWRFKHFATSFVKSDSVMFLKVEVGEQFDHRSKLLMLNYGFEDRILPVSAVRGFHTNLIDGPHSVEEMATKLNIDIGIAMRIALWLHKFGFIDFETGDVR